MCVSFSNTTCSVLKYQTGWHHQFNTQHIWSEYLQLSVNSPATVVGTRAEVEDSFEMDSLSTVCTVLLVTLSTGIEGRWVKSVQLVI